MRRADAAVEAAAVARPAPGSFHARVLHGLRRVFARAVGEHDAVGDDDLFGHVHVARQPRRRQLPVACTCSSL